MSIKVVLASTTWSALNAFKRKAYTSGILKQKRLPSRVVSIGNLQAGGTGKTPVVSAIAQEALKKGIRVCILTRGYKSAYEKKGGIIEPFQKRPPVQECGDEPALIHERVPEAWIGIGADRVKSYEEICRRMGTRPELVLLDDGFQKSQLYRDLDIVLVTSHDRSQVYYREFTGALEQAALRVWTKGLIKPSLTNVRLRFNIPYHTKPETRFLLVTSIADPDELLLSLKIHGYSIEREWRMGDHELPTREGYLACMAQARARALQILMTGKDYVKFQDLFMDRGRLEAGIAEPTVIEPEVQIVEGADLWNRLLWG